MKQRQPDLISPEPRLITVDLSADDFLTLCSDQAVQILRFGRIGNAARYRVEYVELDKAPRGATSTSEPVQSASRMPYRDD